MLQQSVYDHAEFFALYQKLRSNPHSVNEIVEKPTMLALLPDLNGKKVLDMGCGTGEHLCLYLQRGAAFVVGMDLSQTMLKQAQVELEKLAKNRPHFALYHLPMENLSALPQAEFDVITSSFAFHYVEDFSALLAQIYAKLKAGGELVFSQEHPIVTCYRDGERWEKDENKRQIAYRLNYYREEGERTRRWFRQPFNTYHRTVATIMNNLIAAGFRIEHIAEPMLTQQPQWQAEFKDLQHRPLLFFVKAKKE
ncbi:class I SAM-dependent methyltransferase [Necropsobacter massiliensis]|uniref:class I SAM-dependent methyltransferase n=1 Tax=Necropsobacter massiliensis TaxID=1400001 RepID=UPI000595F189|nr:class I SAM-dependent methyltransferase [Necropsobacter massiliensis]